MDFNAAAQWLDEVEGCSMPALQIRPEEIGRYDYARHRNLRARLLSVPSPRIRLAAQVYDAPIGPEKPVILTDREIAAIEAAKAARFEGALSANRWCVLVDTVCRIHGFNRVELFSDRRKHAYCIARHELWWVAAKYIPWSLPRFGRASGGRDHTTILHGIRSYEAKIQAGKVQSELLAAVKYAQLFSEDESAAALVEG
jgi:hypothetical protein